MLTLKVALRHYHYAIQFLGFGRGTEFFAISGTKRLFGSDRDTLAELAPPNLVHPITLRPLTSDWLVAVDIFLKGAYALPQGPYAGLLAARERRLRAEGKVPVIIDCGANIGLSAIWFAHRFPNAIVVAVEPEPGNFALLARNAAPYPNIRPVRAAISDRLTRVSLANGGIDPWSWATTEQADGACETTTVADLLAGVAGASPLIVKVDIEGAEVDLFRSHADWMDQAPLIVFEDHDWLYPGRGTFAAVIRQLMASPRDYLRAGENTFAFSHDLLAEPDAT